MRDSFGNALGNAAVAKLRSSGSTTNDAANEQKQEQAKAQQNGATYLDNSTVPASPAKRSAEPQAKPVTKPSKQANANTNASDEVMPVETAPTDEQLIRGGYVPDLGDNPFDLGFSLDQQLLADVDNLLYNSNPSSGLDYYGFSDLSGGYALPRVSQNQPASSDTSWWDITKGIVELGLITVNNTVVELGGGLTFLGALAVSGGDVNHAAGFKDYFTQQYYGSFETNGGKFVGNYLNEKIGFIGDWVNESRVNLGDSIAQDYGALAGTAAYMWPELAGVLTGGAVKGFSKIDFNSNKKGEFPTGIGGTGSNYDKANGQGLYVLRDENNAVKYVGRGDAPNRFLAHGNSTDKYNLSGETIWTNNLDVAQAKGLEQRLMNHFGGAKSQNIETPLLNKIRSYAPTNPKASIYDTSVTDDLWRETLKRVN